MMSYCLNCGDSAEDHDVDEDGNEICEACYECDGFDDDMEDD